MTTIGTIVSNFVRSSLVNFKMTTLNCSKGIRMYAAEAPTIAIAMPLQRPLKLLYCDCICGYGRTLGLWLVPIWHQGMNSQIGNTRVELI